MPEVDAIVVGLGPGGELASAKLARSGLTVVGIEQHLVGGECPFYGCIGSKMMIRAANSLAEGRRIAQLAGTAVITPDFDMVLSRIRDDATSNWDDTERVAKLEKIGVEVVRGRGRLVAADAVEVDGETYRARRGIVLNPGTSPAVPPVPGLEGTPYWTNRDIFSIEALPASMIVIGAGPIGAELSQVFARFGCAVTVVDQADRLVPADEPEAAERLREIFSREGLRLRLGKPIESVAYVEGSGFTVRVDGENLTAERLLVAAGRRPNLENLGLDAIGVDPAESAVDERFRLAEGVWLVGDAAGHGAFTHTSLAQARVAVADLLGESVPVWKPDEVPWCTYTDPEIGGVGLTESRARERGLDVVVGLVDLTNTSRGWLHHAGNEGIIKLVIDAERDVVVGATCMGPSGGEVIAALGVAIRAELGTHELGQLLFAYPTFAGGIHNALKAASAR